MADRKLTPEEKAQKEQEKQLKLKEKQEKEAEKAQKESNINILKMIYENVRTSKHEDLYIVFDGEKHGVVDGIGTEIIPVEFTNISTSNDRVLKVYGAETSSVSGGYTSLGGWNTTNKVTSVFDYSGNMLIPPNIYTKTVNVGKRGILLGYRSSSGRYKKHIVYSGTNTPKGEEWTGINREMTTGDTIYFIDYETLTVLKFKAPTRLKDKKEDKFEFCVETYENYDNVLVVYTKDETNKIIKHFVEIDEAIEYSKTHDDDNYPRYLPAEFFEHTVTLSSDTPSLIEEITENMYLGVYKESIAHELNTKVACGSSDEYYFGKRNGKWWEVNTALLPISSLHEKARARSKGRLVNKNKKFNKEVWA